MCRRNCLLCLLWFTFSWGAMDKPKAAQRVADCSTVPSLFLSKAKRPTVSSPTTVCQDSLVQLNVRDFVKGSSFQWQRGGVDVSNANDSVLVIRGSQSGSYSCLLRSPLCPSPIVSASVIINANSKPLVSVAAGNPIGVPCKEGTVKLSSNSSGNGALKYQWYFENQPIQSATSNVFDAVETGVYYLKVVDAFDCANTSEALTVITYTPPKADLSTSRIGFCKGEKVTLKVTHGRTYLYQWLQNGQVISGSRDSISVNQPGTYSVKVTAPNSCTTESNQISVVQYDDPLVAIVASGNQTCPGGTLLLTAQGKDLKAFEWKKEGQSIQNETKNTIKVTEAGNYTVAVRDTNRCFATSTAFKIEMVAKIIVVLGKISDFCGVNSSVVVLKGSPSGGEFSGNGVMKDTFNPQLAGYGEHTLSYTVKGSVDCMNGEAKQTVRISPPPQLDLGPDQRLLKGHSISVNAHLGVGYTYEWTPTKGVSDATHPAPTLSPAQSTTYRVKATGPSKCVAEDSIHIVVFTQLYIPDVFSPNQDGVNDTWEIKGLEDYPEAEVAIFNRWGETIFYNKGLYQAPFDGTINGKPLPIGIYTYLITTEPHSASYRGHLLLGR